MIIQECKISKALFACFCGLIASGYNISDPVYGEIVNEIKNNINLENADLEFFKKARIETEQINPYWPYGFLLTVCCLYLEHNGGLGNFEDYVKSNNDLPNEIKTDEMLFGFLSYQKF